MLSRHNFLKGSTKCLSKSSACFFTGLFAVGSAQPGVGFASEKIGNEKVNSIVKSEKDSVPDYEKKKDIALAKLKALKNECSSCIESSKKSDPSESLSTEVERVINSNYFRKKFIRKLKNFHYKQRIGRRFTDEDKEKLKAMNNFRHLVDDVGIDLHRTIVESKEKFPSISKYIHKCMNECLQRSLRKIHEEIADNTEINTNLEELEIFENLVNVAYEVLNNSKKYSTGRKKVAEAVLNTFSEIFAKIPEKDRKSFFKGKDIVDKFQNVDNFFDFNFYEDIFMPLLKYMESDTELEYNDLKIPKYNVSLSFFEDLFKALERIKDIESNKKMSPVQKSWGIKIHGVCLEMIIKNSVKRVFYSPRQFNEDLLYDGLRLFENEYFLDEYQYFSIYKGMLEELASYAVMAPMISDIKGEKGIGRLPANLWYIILSFSPMEKVLKKVNSLFGDELNEEQNKKWVEAMSIILGCFPKEKALKQINGLWENTSNEVQNRKWIEVISKVLSTLSKEEALGKINDSFWGKDRSETPDQKWFNIVNALYPE